MQNPVLSIITVTYNAAQALQKTMGSVSEQVWKDYEHIIIDGKSGDNTANVIHSYGQIIGDRLKWISEPDKGIYDAMNKGLDLAQGQYILFLNAGDLFYDTNTLAKIFENTSEDEVDVYYGETMVVDNNYQEIGLRRLKAPPKLTEKSLLRGMVVCHQSFIPKLKIAPKYNLDYQCSADYEWELICVKRAKTIKNANIIISKFLDGGKSKQTIIPSLKERFKIMRHNFGLLKTLIAHIPISIRFLMFFLKNKRF